MRKFTAALLAAALVIAPAITMADPVDIEFVSPETTKVKGKKAKGKKKNQAQSLPTLQYYLGWPLTIKLVMKDELGITTSHNSAPFFPVRGQAGFIVFSDPDECLAMDSPDWISNCFDDGGLELPSDELYVEFTPDIDDIGLPDDAGHLGLRSALVDSYSAGLSGLNTYIGAATGVMRDVYDENGNIIGQEEIVDGYGKGADDDIPGLVLVTQLGQGIVWSEDYTAKQPLELVNLAGYVNTVGYGLNDAKQRTFVMAQMIVPGSLFAPAVFFDTCYETGVSILPDESNCELWWSVEGGAPEPVNPDDPGSNVTAIPKAEYYDVFSATEYTVSAFVVSGVGPDTVTDMDGSGTIDDADLELLGYHVLGSKKSVTFDQIAGDACFGPMANSLIFADLDGNGETGVTDACGPGSGSLTKVPR